MWPAAGVFRRAGSTTDTGASRSGSRPLQAASRPSTVASTLLVIEKMSLERGPRRCSSMTYLAVHADVQGGGVGVAGSAPTS